MLYSIHLPTHIKVTVFIRELSKLRLGSFSPKTKKIEIHDLEYMTMKSTANNPTNTVRFRTNLKAGQRAKRKYPQDDSADQDAP